MLLALNDPHVGSLKDFDVSAHAAHVQVIRWSAGIAWSDRIARLPDVLAKFPPHVVSWQFVPYGYDPKGLPSVEPFRAIAALFSHNVLRHAFLHELWIGLCTADNLKHRIIGGFQRRRLLAWLRVWKPRRLATSNPVYREVLRREGLAADCLPLFGNLPIQPHPLTRDPGEWVVATFGTLHPQWNPVPTAEFLVEAARHAQMRLRFLILGRSGNQLSAVQAAFRSVSKTEPEVHASLLPERASLLIQSADVGIAPHPWALIGKSGAALGFLEHGVPVIVPRDDWRLRKGETPQPIPEPLLTRLRELTPDNFQVFLQKRAAPESRVDDVCAWFLNSVQQQVTEEKWIAT